MRALLLLGGALAFMPPPAPAPSSRRFSAAPGLTPAAAVATPRTSLAPATPGVTYSREEMVSRGRKTFEAHMRRAATSRATPGQTPGT